MTTTNLGVERALIILKYLSISSQPMGVRGLSREFGYGPAGVQKLMNALVAQGFVIQDANTKRYALGSAVLQTGLAFLGNLQVRRVARPIMEDLAKITGETVLLGVGEDAGIFYIDKVLPSSEIRMDVRLGMRRPYHCTAVGKIILAHQPVGVIDQVRVAGGLDQKTPNTITNPEELAAELEECCQKSYARDCEEFKLGLQCVAAPIYDHDSQLVAAISVAGPAGRIEAELDALIEHVLTKSQEISVSLGYRFEIKEKVA
jgi:DNA-binding IclR family transcriptional regulator|tara:strand:+ start:1671 stop:2450 length:780 start_codon:yes stop_codon:yes gene_type:complete